MKKIWNKIKRALKVIWNLFWKACDHIRKHAPDWVVNMIVVSIAVPIILIGWIIGQVKYLPMRSIRSPNK